MVLAAIAFSSCNKKTVEIGYSGNDISDKASIVRDKTTKKASLVIHTEGEWSLYAGNSVDQIDLNTPILIGKDKGTFEISVNDTARSYFQLVTNEGNAILAERHLPMAGGYNFRDLGGFKTKDGKFVKWGKVFRSDDLYKLTDTDLNYLASIPLISIVDFRAQSEIDLAPDKNPSSLKTNYALSITPGQLNSWEKIQSLTTAQMDSAMMNINIDFVTNPEIIEHYKTFFDLLQNQDEVPLMFHCSAGKDRTGMGAALFLSALGVDEETIMNDYLSSNNYLAEKYAPMIAEHPSLEPMFTVKKEFIQAGLNQIKKDHGSIEAYLTNVLKVNLEKMRSTYLY